MTVIIYISAVILALLIFILFTRVKIVLEADADAKVFLKVHFFTLQLYPKKEKKLKISDYTPKRLKQKAQKSKRSLEKSKKKAKKTSGTSKGTSKEKQKLTYTDIVELTELVVALLKTFFPKINRHLKLELTKVHINVASEDAAKTAIAYGAVSAAVSTLVDYLDNTLTVKPRTERDIAVYPDFLSEKSSVDIRICASLRAWQIVDIAFSLALRFVKEKFL